MSIYIASSSKNSTRAKVAANDLAQEGFEILAAWLKFRPGDRPESTFWRICLSQIHRADAVVVIPDPQAPLRGALVEAGFALGLNKPVFLYNPDELSVGTWAEAPGVIEVTTWKKLTGALRGWAE